MLEAVPSSLNLKELISALLLQLPFLEGAVYSPAVSTNVKIRNTSDCTCSYSLAATISHKQAPKMAKALEACLRLSNCGRH